MFGLRRVLVLIVLGYLLAVSAAIVVISEPTSAADASDVHGCVFIVTGSLSTQDGTCQENGTDFILNCAKIINVAGPDDPAFIDIDCSDLPYGNVIDQELCTKSFPGDTTVTCGVFNGLIVECNLPLDPVGLEEPGDAGECKDVSDIENLEVPNPADNPTYFRDLCVRDSTRSVRISPVDPNDTFTTYHEHAVCPDANGTYHSCHKSANSTAALAHLSFNCPTPRIFGSSNISEACVAELPGGSALSDPEDVFCSFGNVTARCLDAEPVLEHNYYTNCTAVGADGGQLTPAEANVVFQTGALPQSLTSDDCNGTVGANFSPDNYTELSGEEKELSEHWGAIARLLYQHSTVPGCQPEGVTVLYPDEIPENQFIRSNSTKSGISDKVTVLQLWSGYARVHNVLAEEELANGTLSVTLQQQQVIPMTPLGALWYAANNLRALFSDYLINLVTEFNPVLLDSGETLQQSLETAADITAPFPLRLEILKEVRQKFMSNDMSPYLDALLAKAGEMLVPIPPVIYAPPA